ncbi:hypothetical protein [Thalassobaculum sp.]|uniref:hypothetical protein n=1 Tax=Thalassobaculum sp. TaxID=2022740 RepID=UPI0032EFF36B
MALAKVTFPDGTSFSNQSPEDVVDPLETGLADGGHDPGLIVLITKLLEEWNTRILAVGGLGAAVGYVFDDSTDDADTGDGLVHLNGAANAATRIYADLLDLNGVDVTALLDTFNDSTSAEKGIIALRQSDDNANWAIYQLTGVEAVAGYRKLTVVPIVASAPNPFADGATLQLSFSRTGNEGAEGPPGGGLPSVADDASPQLGADLDVNGHGLVSTANGNIPIQPHGTGRTSIKNPTITGSPEGGYDNVGNVTGAAVVTGAVYSRIALTGDTTVTITAPTASTLGACYLEVEQGASGGWVPSFTGYTWVGDAPDWPNQAEGHITLLGHFATPTGLKRIWVIEEVAP